MLYCSHMTKTLIDIDAIPRHNPVTRSGEATAALNEALTLADGKGLLFGFDSKADATRFAKAAMTRRSRYPNHFKGIKVIQADTQVSLSR